MQRHFLQKLFWSFIVFFLNACACALAQQANATNYENTNISENTTLEAARRKQIERIVESRLIYYSSHYPDISFSVLDTAGDVERNMHILARIVGDEPNPIDYAHPPDVRHTLLMVTLMRIKLMLEIEVGSATLFKPGSGALAKRKQVCVVTVNPWLIAANARVATRNLLEIPDAEFATIPPSHYLDPDSHLKFTLDHEIYHCLDSSINGPIPVSQRQYWGGYYMLKHEAGADAFGLIMHIAEHNSITAFARMLKPVRGLAFLGEDPNHFTYLALDAVLKHDPAELANMDLESRFLLATRIRRQVVGSYDDYLRYARAAKQAMRQLGLSVRPGNFGKAKVDENVVKRLLRYTQNSYHALTGHDLPPAR